MAGSVHPGCACKRDCPRHGLCAACLSFHEDAGTLTKCQRIAKQPVESPASKIAVRADAADVVAEVI